MSGAGILSDLELAELCQAIYESPSPVSWDKEYISPLFSHAALKRINGVAYVVRRGSRSPEDWYRDLGFWPMRCPPLNTHVHGGIIAGVLWTFDQIEADIGDDPFVLTGHSLGAGEAILQGGLMIAAGKHPQAVVAFEPPRVAFKSLCDPDRTRCYRNRADPVPEVPVFEIPLVGCYVPEKPFIALDGPADPADTSPLREHHITCVIAGLKALAH